MSAASVLIAGGGLSGSLLAWALRSRRPDASVRLVERSATLGGNHTWSFHGGDLTADEREWIAPLVCGSWSGYDVAFPAHRRTLEGSYHSIRSERFHEVLSERLGETVRYGEAVGALDGSEARCVIDARGFGSALRLGGWQKFVGLDLELENAHGLSRPTLMDATVDQLDGFRFFYVLPWPGSERRLLIEDTRYSASPEIDAASFEAEIRAYAAKRGWRIARVERAEAAALPIPVEGAAEPPGPVVARIGVRASFFHETTGYSLPLAVRTALGIAALPELTTESVRRFLARQEQARQSQSRFYLILNRMLFGAALPRERYRVLERFYRLPEGLIERFYAGRTSALDIARILMGRPPVPVGRALRSIYTYKGEART